MRATLRLALLVLVFAAMVPGARAEIGVDCHGFADPAGDASSPAVDVVAASFDVEGPDLVVRVALDDLSAPLTQGAVRAEYYVDWEPEYGPFQLSALGEDGAWTFSGSAHREAVAVGGSVHPTTSTIEMRIDASLVEDFPILTDASVATFEATPFMPVLFPTWSTRTDLAFANEIAPGIARPGDPAADSGQCAVLTDDTEDGRLIAGEVSVADVVLPSPGHIVRETGVVHPDTGDATEIEGMTAATVNGRLALRLRVADLDAPRWPGTNADVYRVAWWADAPFGVTGVHDDDGWWFSGDAVGAPMSVSATVGDDELSFEIALAAMPAVAAGRPLTEWYASGASVVAGQEVLWPYYTSPWFDEAPNDLDPGWFVSGGACVPDWQD